MVNTEVGACLEPRDYSSVVEGNIVDNDSVGENADRITFIDEGIMATTYFTAGTLIPIATPMV